MRLADVLGHAPPRALLLRAIVARSVPQSLLFDGPDGVGKRTMALALASAINCQQPAVDGDACGSCSSCKRIARAQHPDIVSLAPNEKGTITVEMAREIIGQASYRPFEARRRVVIVNEADSLQPSAQNALLKTLEEPPPSSMFVLITRPTRLAARDRAIEVSARALRPAGPDRPRRRPGAVLRRESRRGRWARGDGRWQRGPRPGSGHRCPRGGARCGPGAAAGAGRASARVGAPEARAATGRDPEEAWCRDRPRGAGAPARGAVAARARSGCGGCALVR